MGKPIYGKWANNYDIAQLQVQKSPWNFKWGESIQHFQRYAFRKVWTQFVANLTSFWPTGKPIWGKWPSHGTTAGLDNSTELRTEKIRQVVTEIWVSQVWQPPARTVTTIPLQPEGLRGKNDIKKATWNCKILKNRSKDRDNNFLVAFSSSKAQRPIKREGMTHWCWPQFVMTHGMCSTCST